MPITNDMELPIIPAADEMLPSVIACRAEIERLRTALDPFARHAHCVDQVKLSSWALWCAQALNALSDQKENGK